jgi:cysteinyl-tRNA synthetase
MDDSYSQNHLAGYISFAADERDLNRIPAYPDPIFNENTDVVDSLEAVRNFLYILDPSDFGSKQGLIQAVTATNYDLLIMDLFWESEVFSPAEVLALRQKANGGKRLLLAYMSIGEAEDYRYYWDPGWKNQPPVWLDQENPAWKGNFKVRYWEPEWQSIIFGNDSSYVKQILDAGFDGVYLDIIDAFEFYEGQ